MRSDGERTGRPVTPSGQELNVGNAQVRVLLHWLKEQVLAECQAEIKKHEFQANYYRTSVRNLGETIESQQELHCAQAEEIQRRDQQFLNERLLQQNSELREAHDEEFQWNGRIEELPEFHLWHCCKTKSSRGSEYDFVKSIFPKQENSMQCGYDENDNYDMSDETKRETNHSINNKWNNTRNKALH